MSSDSCLGKRDRGCRTGCYSLCTNTLYVCTSCTFSRAPLTTGRGEMWAAETCVLPLGPLSNRLGIPSLSRTWDYPGWTGGLPHGQGGRDKPGGFGAWRKEQGCWASMYVHCTSSHSGGKKCFGTRKRQAHADCEGSVRCTLGCTLYTTAHTGRGKVGRTSCEAQAKNVGKAVKGFYPQGT